MNFHNPSNLKRWIPSIIILPIAIYFVLNRGHYTLIDNADLVIHEAGHAVFFIFGKFIYTLGGTLMQIILPSIIAWYFLSNNYRIGVQFAILWLGQNLVNISVYAADAQEKSLPLLGGNKVYHDWNWILTKTRLLEYDSEIGLMIFSLAIITFLITIFLPLIIKD